MEVPSEVNNRALSLANDAGVPVIFNYAPTRGAPVVLDERMSVLVVNENEAAELLGVSAFDPVEAVDAAHQLAASGPGTAVITLGAAGAVAAHAGDTLQVTALRVDVKDTTAAGDTFCGCLATALSEKMLMSAALAFANTAAALATTDVGAQPSIPRREEIMARLNV